MKPIIRVENLSKQYRIGAQQASYSTLRDSITNAFTAPFKNTRNPKPETRNSETLWALKDINFEVHPGEVVGIIGRNGAGKSTLLKILSRITEPTTGRVDLYGRVGSLLEVGTGFHPELTGRENIYLNGAVLGMKHEEIKRRFDEIVAFAEVEKFLDTPVKHYSSGMYMRLAFAVAAHLDPEILIIDEVLAVGDAPFQKKCLGKLEEIGSQGRTVLFVSHSIPMIMRLCSRVVLLDRGAKIADGAPPQMARIYLQPETGNPGERVWLNEKQSPGDSVVRLYSVRVLNENNQVVNTIDVKKQVFIEVVYKNLQEIIRPTAIIHFVNEDGICLFASNEFNSPMWTEKPLKPGLVRARCIVPANFLAEGQIILLVAVGSYNPNVIHAIEKEAVSFQVVDNGGIGSVRREFAGEWPGVLRPFLDWQVQCD